jgi:hypothetical protein
MAGLTWELLHEVFTAETLMTPRDDLFVGEYGTDLSTQWAEAKRRNFDLLPVVKSGYIVGVLAVAISVGADQHCGEAVRTPS